LPPALCRALLDTPFKAGSSMSRIRVLIADDHAVVREGLAMVIGSQPDMRVVAQVADGEAAVRAASEQQPHVALLDMRMPGLGGVAAIRRMRETCPETRVLVLSMYEDRRYVAAARGAGAHAYVAKRSGGPTLLRAIRALHAGDVFVDAVVEGAVDDPFDAPAASSALSPREREVLRLVLDGHTNREMAERLGISKSSVDTYRARIFEKLRVESRAELLARVGDRAAHASPAAPDTGGPEAT
jgi:two-component system response regulator NreC